MKQLCQFVDQIFKTNCREAFGQIRCPQGEKSDCNHFSNHCEINLQKRKTIIFNYAKLLFSYFCSALQILISMYKLYTYTPTTLCFHSLNRWAK